MIYYPEKREKVLSTGKRGKYSKIKLLFIIIVSIFLTSGGFYFYKEKELQSYSLATLKIEGLYCPSCPPRVKAAIESVPGVIKADVDLSNNSAIVYFDSRITEPEKFITAISHAGTGGYKGELLVLKESGKV